MAITVAPAASTHVTEVSAGKRNVPESKPASPAKQDTVRLSSAAQALQEATETQAQTAREARGGDVQATRLLAREASAAKVLRG